MAFKKPDKKSSWGKRPSGGSSGAEKVYTLQVDLADTPLTCVIEIAGSHTLEQLHEMIDAAFNRDESGVWDFQTGLRGHHDSQNRRYGPPDLEDQLADNASETSIDDLKLKQGSSFSYTFDPENPREHSIEVVNVQKTGRLSEPRIVKSASARPAREVAGRVDEQSPAKQAAAEFVSSKRSEAMPRLSASAGVARPLTTESRSTRPPERAALERDAQAAACSYILVALLQRLEKVQPGLTKDLLAGIEADRAAIDLNMPDRDFIERIFDEALKTVRQAAAGIP